MGNRATDAVAALRAYAREIEADVERSAHAPLPVSRHGDVTMPSASAGARFIAPLVIVSAVVMGLAGTAVALLGTRSATPPVAAPLLEATADSAPLVNEPPATVFAERAVLRLRTSGLDTAATSIETAVQRGIVERADVQAAIASLMAVLDERVGVDIEALLSDPVVLAASNMLEAIVRPPGLDPDFTPPGLGGTPPGQDPDFTPPGNDPDFVPPGQDDDFVPPGQDDDFVPPGQDEDRTPPDQSERADR